MVRMITLLLLLAGFIVPSHGWAGEARWETLEATMVILKEDAPLPPATNQISLPPQLQARLRERMEQRKSGPAVTPIPVATGRNGR